MRRAYKTCFENYLFVKIVDSVYLNDNVKLGRLYAKPAIAFSPESVGEKNHEKGGRYDPYDGAEEQWIQNKRCGIDIRYQGVSMGGAHELTVRAEFLEMVGIYCLTMYKRLEIRKHGINIDRGFLTKFQFQSQPSAIIITQPMEWLRRIVKATNDSQHIKCCRLPNEKAWCGSVRYRDLNKAQGRVGYFQKDNCYRWQNEFRMVFMDSRKVDAIRLDIGSIEDISETVFLNK